MDPEEKWCLRIDWAKTCIGKINRNCLKTTQNMSQEIFEVCFKELMIVYSKDC